MGVTKTDYLIYGWKLSYEFKGKNGKEVANEWFEDKYLPYIEGHPGIKYTLITDGMCGEYIVFGRLLDHRSDDTGDTDFKEIDASPENLNEQETCDIFTTLFGVEIPNKPKLIVFSHYS